LDYFSHASQAKKEVVVEEEGVVVVAAAAVNQVDYPRSLYWNDMAAFYVETLVTHQHLHLYIARHHVGAD
jgi:hypothetical protein